MTNMTRSEKGFFKGFIIAALSTLFWIGVAVLIVTLNGCAANVDAAQSNAEPVSTCSAATAEAGADLSQCSTTVLTVSVNPIVVTCLSASGSRPAVSLVGNGVCEQGTSDRVWCCVPMPAVGL